MPITNSAIMKIVLMYGLKGAHMNNIEFNRLYEQYKELDINQLEIIARNESGEYTEDAQRAALALMGNEGDRIRAEQADRERQEELKNAEFNRQQQERYEAIRRQQAEQERIRAQQHQAWLANEARKNEARRSNPLYDDIHQIAEDVRWFKILTIVLLTITVVAGIIAGIAIVASM